MTLLELYNLCLSRLGSRQVLTATTGTDPVSLAVAGAYPVARDALLRAHPWPFATFHQELAQVAVDVPRWGYVYAYPEDTLAITRLYTDSTPDGRSEDFCILSNGDGTEKIVATDVSPAYARRILAITDPDRFDADFADALSYRVAADLALPLANDMNLREHLMKMHYQLLAQAQTASSREKTAKVPVVGRYRGSRQ